jgi:hypothetical protein
MHAKACYRLVMCCAHCGVIVVDYGNSAESAACLVCGLGADGGGAVRTHLLMTIMACVLTGDGIQDASD